MSDEQRLCRRGLFTLAAIAVVAGWTALAPAAVPVSESNDGAVAPLGPSPELVGSRPPLPPNDGAQQRTPGGGDPHGEANPAASIAELAEELKRVQAEIAAVSNELRRANASEQAQSDAHSLSALHATAP